MGKIAVGRFCADARFGGAARGRASVWTDGDLPEKPKGRSIGPLSDTKADNSGCNVLLGS